MGTRTQRIRAAAAAGVVLVAVGVAGCGSGSSGGTASGGTASGTGAATPGGTGTAGSTPSVARGPVDQAAPGTVLLVPGYGGNVRDLDALRDLLRSRGRTVVEVQTPGTGTGDLRRQAAALAAAAADAIAAGAPSVDVVGYSAGGIVARVYVAEQGGAAVVRRVVTIGSPHHGTQVALLVNGSAVPPRLPPAQARQRPAHRPARAAGRRRRPGPALHEPVERGRRGDRPADVVGAGRGRCRPAAGRLRRRHDDAHDAAADPAGRGVGAAGVGPDVLRAAPRRRLRDGADPG